MNTMKQTGVSLYYQVAESIKAKIESGEWPRGSRLPSEPELTVLFAVSRSTIRQAISILVKEGLLVRKQGSGTYEYMRQYLAENQIVPKDTVTFSSNYAIKEALLNNVGITLISEYVVADELKSGAIIRLPMQREIIRDYSYLIREGQPVSPALADFIHLLESNG